MAYKSNRVRTQWLGSRGSPNLWLIGNYRTGAGRSRAVALLTLLNLLFASDFKILSSCIRDNKR
jgi:hypothetical protein